MQLDYKDIIIKHYALSMFGSEIARQTGFSKSGVNDFLRAFKKCEDLSYPLPAGITNYGIALKVYGSVPGSGGRNENIELPDYEEAAKLMATRKNMTLMFLWNRYKKKCEEEGARFYQYSQYCELYNKWCEENYETAHFDAVVAQKMEVDFAGQTFSMTDPLTGEIMHIVVFVAILPYSQYIYTEGMLSTKEPQWIDVNNHAYEVQTYRMCLGILNFTKKYSNKAIEECCKQAIALNKQKYTFIKNTISVVANDLGEAGYHHSTSVKKEPVRGGYVMPPEASSIDTLLSRNRALADQMREEVDD